MLTSLADEVVAYVLGPAPCRQQGQASFIGDELGFAPGRPSLRRIRLLAGIWLAYAGGAVAGSVTHAHWALDGVVVPVAALLGVIAVEVRRPIEAPVAGSRP
jgi:hypothetical protein